MNRGRRLPIGSIDVVGADGSIRVALHVFCPRDVCAVRLDTCSRCAECQWLDPGTVTGTRPTVVCGAAS